MPFGFFGSFVNAAANAANFEKQRAHEERLQKLDQEYNERMWHMQNEYNSPVKQMERLREAGINPATSYGSVASGSISKSPPYTHHNPVARPPEVQIRLPEVFDLMGQIKSLKGQDLENERRGIENERARTDLLFQKEFLDTRNKLAINDLLFKYGLQPYQIQELMARTNRTNQEYDYYKEVNPIRLNSWKTFGTESVPWYLKTGNNWIDKMYDAMMEQLGDIGSWDLKTWFIKAEEARSRRRGQKSFFSK